MRQVLLLVLLTMPLTFASSQIQLSTKPTMEEPDWLRLKRMCNIPDTEQWSLKTKLKYAHQIDSCIKELDRRCESRLTKFKP